MKIAVISDIHGNLPALEAVLEDIKKYDVDTIICLGDLVGYGPFPNEVIDYIRSKNILMIMGNYDKAVAFNDIGFIKDNELNREFCLPWSVNEVTSKNKKFLMRLPENITFADKGKSITFVHGSIEKINEYLLEDSKEAEKALQEADCDVLVCGHTHLPYVKEDGNKLLINDGSVGKPKIGRPNSTYVIINFDENNISSEIIEIPYNMDEIVRVMNEKEFPKKLIDSFKEGKA